MLVVITIEKRKVVLVRITFALSYAVLYPNRS